MTSVIDTHLHCWDRSRFRYDWLEGTDLPWRFTPAEIEAESDVDRVSAVFMEADRTEEQAFDEAAWALDLRSTALGAPDIVAAVAHVPLSAHTGAALDALEPLDRVTGARRLLQDEPEEFFTDADTVSALRLIGRHGLVFDACVREHQLTTLADLADRAAGTTIVLDHLGKPEVTQGGQASHGVWHAGIQSLAARPNVVVKLSGLTATDGSFAQCRPWVVECLEAFGPDRVVLGSDWPVSRSAGVPYTAWFSFVLRDCGLLGEERTAVASSNAAKLYRIPSGSSTVAGT